MRARAAADETLEQRMPIARVRRELGVELAGEEQRMLRQLDHLDEVIDRQPGKTQSGFSKLLAIVVVDLVAMAVPLVDLVLP